MLRGRLLGFSHAEEPCLLHHQNESWTALGVAHELVILSQDRNLSATNRAAHRRHRLQLLGRNASLLVEDLSSEVLYGQRKRFICGNHAAIFGRISSALKVAQEQAKIASANLNVLFERVSGGEARTMKPTISSSYLSACDSKRAYIFRRRELCSGL